MSQQAIFIAVDDIELQEPNSSIYVLIKSQIEVVRTSTTKSGMAGTYFSISELVNLKVDETGIFQLEVHVASRGAFSTDPLLGELVICIKDLDETEGWFDLRVGRQEPRYSGRIKLDIQIPMKGVRGKTFNKTDMALLRNVEELRDSGIGGSSSSSNVKNVRKIIKQAMTEQSQELDVSGMDLSICPAELGEVAKITKSLDLGFNKFQIYPDISVLGFQFLQTLTLTGNQLESLSPAIAKLGRLQELYLNGNRLQMLPVEITDLDLLEKLDISNNQLTYLLPEIGKLTNLQDLLASGNPFGQIPVEIGECKSLELIDLSSCQLQSLPNQFSNMTKLMELNLGDNQLTTLPSNFGKLTRLVALNLCDNHLRDLPISMGYCLGLINVHIDRNPIQDRELLSKYQLGCDHLVDYLESRMISYLSERGINPSAISMAAKSEESIRFSQQVQAQEESLLRAKLEAEADARAREEEEMRRQMLLASQTQQERNVNDKLQQAKVMGFAILDDIQIKITNLEMVVAEVTSTKAGIPFARLVNSTKPDIEFLQKIVGWQKQPEVRRPALAIGSLQLQNFKYSLLLQLALLSVTLDAVYNYLQMTEDPQNIVNLVKGARSIVMKFSAPI